MDDSKNTHRQAAPEDEQLSDRDIRTIMVGLMLALLLAALDMTIVGPAMSTIGRDLGDYARLPWVVTAYLLVSTTLTPLYGKLADIHGRRIMLLSAIGAFVAGSVACALAPSLLALTVARAFQGIGGAGVSAMTMTIIGDIVPLPKRPQYQTYTAIVWTIASLLGPVLGGQFAAWASWRMIFWINVPIGAAAWAIASPRLRRIPRRERPHRLDYLGAALLVAASSLTLLALNGGAQSGEGRLATGSAAILAWVLVAWRQATAEEPLIPLSVLSNRVVVAAMLANGFAMAAYLAVAVFVPLFFQTVLGLSVANAGSAALPLMLGSTIGSAVGAKLMLRVRKSWSIARAGLFLSALSAFVLSTAGPSTSLLWAEALMTALALGLGPLFPVMNVSIQAAVKPYELGTSMSLITFFRNLGAAFGVAVLGVLVVGAVAEDLSSAGRAAGDASLAAHGFHIAFAVVGAGLLCAFLSLFAAREPSLALAGARRAPRGAGLEGSPGGGA